MGNHDLDNEFKMEWNPITQIIELVTFLTYNQGPINFRGLRNLQNSIDNVSQIKGMYKDYGIWDGHILAHIYSSENCCLVFMQEMLGTEGGKNPRNLTRIWFTRGQIRGNVYQLENKNNGSFQMQYSVLSLVLILMCSYCVPSHTKQLCLQTCATKLFCL